MDDLGVIVYIIAAIAYGIYSARKKAKKKAQKKAGKQGNQKSKPQQPQTDQPGRSLEEILKELYPDANQEQKQSQPANPESRRQFEEPQSIEGRPDLNRRIEEAERLLNDPKARRLDLPDIDPVPPPARKKDEINVNFDLRKAIIAKVILDRPYK